jgi:hypothetical protein
VSFSQFDQRGLLFVLDRYKVQRHDMMEPKLKLGLGCATYILEAIQGEDGWHATS